MPPRRFALCVLLTLFAHGYGSLRGGNNSSEEAERAVPPDGQDHQTDLGARAPETNFSHHNLTLAMKGFILGINQSQALHERDQCFVHLKEVRPFIRKFLEHVAESCTSNNYSCIPTISQQVVELSNSSKKWVNDINRHCPRQFNIIFTAAYDPLLPVNMVTLAVMNMIELHRHVNLMFSHLVHRRYYLFGFDLGIAMELILPLVRLPPDREGLRRITHGFVFAFTSEGAFDSVPDIDGNQTLVGDELVTTENEVLELIDIIDRGEVMKEQSYTRKQCLDYVQGEVERVAGALLDVTMGSLLNYTCYKQTVMFQAAGCLSRAFQGLISLGDSINAAFMLLSALQKATCPPRFVQVMNRFQDKRNLTLDFYTNLFEQFGDLQLNVIEALQNLFDDELFDFGHDVGVIVDRVTRPAFYKFERFELHVREYSWPLQVLYLAALKAFTVAVSLLPLLFLFCSAFKGHASKKKEFMVWAAEDATEIGMAYQFFGGRKKIGTEVEILVETLGHLPDGHPGVLLENPRGISSKSSQLRSISVAEEAKLQRARTKIAQTRGSDIMAKASYCIRLTLTDDLPRNPRPMMIVWKLIGRTVPCIGVERRWKLRSFRRGFTEADGGYEDWHEEEAPSKLSVEVANWLHSQLDACAGDTSEDSSASDDSGKSSKASSSRVLGSASAFRTIPKYVASSMRSFRRNTGMEQPRSRGGAGNLMLKVDEEEETEDSEGAGLLQDGYSDDDLISVAGASEASSVLKRRYPRPEARLYANYEHVKPPVVDRPQVNMFSLHRIHAALMRMRPAENRKECFDALLLTSAGVQLFAASWQLSMMFLFGAHQVLLEGELPTFWLQFDRALLASLVIHKKLHAVWYRKVQANLKVLNLPDDERGCCCISRCSMRTPTMVPLFTAAPAVTTTKRPWLPFAYRRRFHLGVGDLVYVISPYHEKCGRSGVITESAADASGQLRIDFADGEPDGQLLVPRDCVELADREDRTRQTPVWHDRLTTLIWRLSMSVWGVSTLLFMLFGKAMSNGNERLVLQLRRQTWDPLHGSLFGWTVFIQCGLVAVEYLVRLCQFCTITLAQAAIYKV